ncbi:MAG: phage portal protein family protein, partial [Chroococcales cyanobacterium]
SGQPAANDERVRIELTKLDGDLLHATLNETLIKWAVEFSFAGAEPPTVWRVFNTEEDLGSRATRDKTLQDMGFRLTFAKFEEIYGEGYEDLNEEEDSLESEIASIMGGDGLQAPEIQEEGVEEEAEPEPEELEGEEADPVEAIAPDFAAGERDSLSDLVERTAITASGQIKDWLSEVRSLVQTVRESSEPDSQKFFQFKEGLLEIQQQSDKSKLAEAIAKASLTSEMGGRFEVLEEIDGDS